MKKITVFSLLIILLLSGCSIKSADDYYNSTEPKGKLSATISINCMRAVEYIGSERKKSEILDDYKVTFNNGDTVFDLLKRACKEKKIQFEYEGEGSSVYINGIDYLYEFDCGDLSGWEYSVNDDFPNVGCNAYNPSDGDTIKWLYTCDLGADIGNVYKGDSDD